MRVFAGLATVVFLSSAVPAGAAGLGVLPVDQAAQTVVATTAPVSAALGSAPAAVTPPSAAPPAPVPAPPIVSQIQSAVRATAPSVQPSIGASGGGAVIDQTVAQVGAAGSAGAPTATKVVLPDAPGVPNDPAGAGARGPRRSDGTGSPEASRPAPMWSFRAHVWPAVALGRSQLTAFLHAWEAATLRLLSSDAAGAGVGGEGITTAPPTLAVADESPRVDPGPSPLDRLLGTDPPLPVAVFYIALIAALGAIWLSSRRELGLPLGRPRWKE